MIQIRNILVPSDFSEPAKKALRYGLSLALQFRARLVVAHVIPSLAAFDAGIAGGVQEIERLAFAEATKSLNDAVPAEYRELVRLHAIALEGDVRERLIEVIRDENIDLVVMGTHGRRNIERFFLGSTTEHVLRKIPVPILIVPAIQEKYPIPVSGPVPIRRIVYAADLSKSAEAGLRYAAEFARSFGAEVKIVHVVDLLETGQWGVEIPGSLPFVFSDIQAQAEQRLREALTNSGSGDLRASITVIEGTPHDAIIRFADEADADLLVMNLQSKGMLERVMLGATAERVIRGSHIPVLSIPVGSVADKVKAHT